MEIHTIGNYEAASKYKKVASYTLKNAVSSLLSSTILSNQYVGTSDNISNDLIIDNVYYTYEIDDASDNSYRGKYLPLNDLNPSDGYPSSFYISLGNQLTDLKDQIYDKLATLYHGSFVKESENINEISETDVYNTNLENGGLLCIQKQNGDLEYYLKVEDVNALSGKGLPINTTIDVEGYQYDFDEVNAILGSNSNEGLVSSNCISFNATKREFTHKFNINNSIIEASTINTYNNFGVYNKQAFIQYSKFVCSSDKIGSFDDDTKVFSYSIDEINRIIGNQDVVITNVGLNNSSLTFRLDKFLQLRSSDGLFIPTASGSSDYSVPFYVYPGYKLNNLNVNYDSTGYASLTYVDKASSNESSIIASSLLKTELGEDFPDLLLYYDESCINPMQIDLSDDQLTYNLYDMLNGKKQYIYNDNGSPCGVISNGVYTSYEYKKLYKYEYEKSTSYALDYAKDWYNINTYINYNLLLKNFNDYYKVYVKLFDESQSKTSLISADPKTFCFSSSSIIDDSINIESKLRQYLGPESKYEIYFKSVGVPKSSTHLDFSSLFTTKETVLNTEFNGTKSQNFSYKMFSFNFKIPKYGWDKLNDEMYAPNPNFKQNILESDEIKTIVGHPDLNGVDVLSSIYNNITPVSALNNLSSSQVIFNGTLGIIYLVLDNRVVEQVVGNGNYGDGGYRDANGVYHKGAKLDSSNIQMGGTADLKLDKAYNANYIKIPFTAKLADGDDTVIVTSPNNTLAFTATFNEGVSENWNKKIPLSKIKSTSSTWGDMSIPSNWGYATGDSGPNYYKATIVTLNGLFTQVTVNGILHNVSIPTLKLFVFLGWKEDDGVKFDYELVITPSNMNYLVNCPKNSDQVSEIDWGDNGIKGYTKGLINHTCDAWRASTEVSGYVKSRNLWIKEYKGITAKATRYKGTGVEDGSGVDTGNLPIFGDIWKIKYGTFTHNPIVHVWQNMAANLQIDENGLFYTWIPLWGINFGEADTKSKTVTNGYVTNRKNQYAGCYIKLSSI